MQFFFEVLIGGLLSGVMYSFVALGFVLIYKASGVFNFAQGAMVFFAALTFVGILEMGVPFWLAVILAFAAMVVLGVATERIVLRPMVNQPPIALFMATIGLTFFIEGAGPGDVGASVRGLDLGIQDEPIEWIMAATDIGGSSSTFCSRGCGGAGHGPGSFFPSTWVGRALRAVADDHQAALSIGIPLQTIWRIVWLSPVLSRWLPA